jgi:translation initiation factor IF-3
MKFRPNIGSADFDMKVRHVRRFLGAGERVKVTVMFRGREIARPERGVALIDMIAARVADVARHDTPRQTGRDLTVVFTPRGRRDGGAGVKHPRRPPG